VEGPAWRWRRAERIARTAREDPAGLLGLPADDWIREAVAYLRCCHASPDGPARAQARHPWIAAAQALWDSTVKRAELKILIIADCSRDEIAQRSGVAGEAVDACEQFFYDVRAARDAVDWIARSVIEPEARGGDGSLASRLKLAFGAGPVAAKMILESDCRPLVGPGARLFDKRLQLHLKLDQALAMPLDTLGGSARFLHVALAFQTAEQRLALQTRSLQQRCEETVRRSECARRKRELSEHRYERWQVQRAQREEQRHCRRVRAEQAVLQRQRERLARQQAAQRRAAACPLAQLRWRSVPVAQVLGPAA
jgi:hypothetical protein